MRLHGWTWAALALGLFALLGANLWCWRPGIGGGGPARPPGTEVELFYGWPATYRAEWWRSDDPALAQSFLERAPFFHPAGALGLQARSARLWPALADTAFAVAVLVVVGVGTEARVRGWRRGMAIGLLLAAILLAGVWAVAEGMSVHL